MSIKRILVPFPRGTRPDEEIALALSAATFLESHVEALFISEPPEPPTSGMAYGEVARMGQVSVAGLRTSPVEEQERAARAAHDAFERACGLAHVPLLDEGADIGAMPSARWREAEGRYSTITVGRASGYDLIIAGSAAVSDTLRNIAEATLLQAGRPVLLAPIAQSYSLSRNPIIAWDNSPQCWSAVSAAVPFLQRADSVQVVSIDKDAWSKARARKDILDYLACHGIAATHRIVEPHSLSIGEALLAEAGEQNSGLLVMGAYSHSRLREMLLGGVTRHILANTATTPVLMAH